MAISSGNSDRPKNRTDNTMSRLALMTQKPYRLTSAGNTAMEATQAALPTTTHPGTYRSGAGTKPANSISATDNRDFCAVGTRGSADVRTIQSPASSWMPPHLLTNENLVTLRERHLTERHVPGYAQSLSSARQSNGSIPPHPGYHLHQTLAISSETQSTVSPGGASTGHNNMTRTFKAFVPGSSRPQWDEGSILTQSTMSSDSRAGIPTLSATSARSSLAPRNQSLNAFDNQGNLCKRTVNHASDDTSTIAARARNAANFRKPSKGRNNFARPVSYL
jgi:hypothetical protein